MYEFIYKYKLTAAHPLQKGHALSYVSWCKYYCQVSVCPTTLNYSGKKSEFKGFASCLRFTHSCHIKLGLMYVMGQCHVMGEHSYSTVKILLGF